MNSIPFTLNIKKLVMLLMLFSNITIITVAQQNPVLKLSEAQSLAMENNYGLKIAEKRIELAKNQIFKANAGMSPVIDWNTNFGTVFNQVNQRFVDGRTIDRFGRSFSPNSNVTLFYTLYDGRRMQSIFQRLQTEAQLSSIQKQLNIQTTLSNIMQVYYNIQRLQNTQEYLLENLKYYEERLKITEERWQIGRGSKLDYLQSKADLSTQNTDLTTIKNQLLNAKIELNGLLSRNLETAFEVEKDDFVNPIYNLSALVEQAKSQNPEFLALKKAEDINLISQKEAQSFKKPRVSLNSGFGYNFNSNNAGLIIFNQSTGLNTVISATWRIFDGQLINRNIQSAKINAEILKIQESDVLNRLETDLSKSFYQYETDKKLLQLELENKALASENLEISLGKFKLGASTILEINDAQTRYNTVLNRLTNAQFNVKISQLELLTTSGNLLK